MWRFSGSQFCARDDALTLLAAPRNSSVDLANVSFNVRFRLRADGRISTWPRVEASDGGLQVTKKRSAVTRHDKHADSNFDGN